MPRSKEEPKLIKKDDFGETYSHPAYGLLKFSRGSVGGIEGEALVGSSLSHHEIISIEITHARRNRNLHEDHFFDDKIILEADMSPTQFADAITGMNCGSGVPITLRWLAGSGNLPEPPFEHKQAEFTAEFEHKMKDIASDVDAVIALALATKAQVRLVDAIKMLKQQIASNIPFIQQQFVKQMDKTITEAKGEVEAFAEHVVMSYGLEALKHQAPQLATPDVQWEAKQLEKLNQEQTTDDTVSETS
jgi:hypothetical protein